MVIPSFKVSDNVNSDIIYVVVKFIESTNSNINEVIRTVLNSLFFFYEKILHAQKAPKSTKEHQKEQKAQKAPKAQRRNQTKAQKRK